MARTSTTEKVARDNVADNAAYNQTPPNNTSGLSIPEREDNILDSETWREANRQVLDDIESIEIRTDGVEVTKRAKLIMSYLGNPRAAVALPEGDYYHVVGYIYGQALGVQDEMLPDGTPTKSLIGEFKGETPDGLKIIESGRLFLPNGIHHEVLAAVLQGGRPQFNLEVRTRRDGNPSGFTYEFVNLISPVMDDRTRIFRKLVERRRQQIQAAQQRAIAGSQKPPALAGGAG